MLYLIYMGYDETNDDNEMLSKAQMLPDHSDPCRPFSTGARPSV